jgi:hypothetical protein
MSGGHWANRHRGEIGAEFDGVRRRLKLTLGALAELEDASGEDLMGLIGRIETGRMSARDAIRILGAGLRGAGEAIDDEEVARMSLAGGPLAAFKLATELIAAAFGVDGREAMGIAENDTATSAPGNFLAPPGSLDDPEAGTFAGGA